MRTLYECEVGNSDLDQSLEDSINSIGLSGELADYCRILVHGVADHQEELDDELDELLTRYDLMRVAAIDRNLLRIAAFEIAHVPYVPPKVSINEAIELSKKYSTAESGRFLNGVLASFMNKGNRSQAQPEAEEEPADREEQTVEVAMVAEDSVEAVQARKLGAWTLKSGSSDSTE